MDRIVTAGIISLLLVTGLAGSGLAEAADETPFVIENTWQGFIACAAHAFGVGGIDCGGIDPNDDRVRMTTVEAGIRGIVFALDWEPQTTTASVPDVMNGPLVLRVVHEESGYVYIRLESLPPLEVILAADVGGDHALENVVDPTEIRIEVNPSGNNGGLAYQQPFTLYSHEYYWEAPDGNASALP